MFLVTNIYFLPYEFLCSSLSFFEYEASILSINKYHFGMVKIISVSFSMFISKYVLKNDFELTFNQSAQ